MTSDVIDLWRKEHSSKNRSKYTKVGRMRNDTRRLLEEFYAPSIERLATLLHDDRFKNMRL